MISEAEPTDGKFISMTPAKLKEFREAFCQACLKNPNMQSVFTFEGNEFVLGYAAYMIQFLEQEFKRKKGKH